MKYRTEIMDRLMSIREREMQPSANVAMLYAFDKYEWNGAETGLHARAASLNYDSVSDDSTAWADGVVGFISNAAAFTPSESAEPAETPAPKSKHIESDEPVHEPDVPCGLDESDEPVLESNIPEPNLHEPDAPYALDESDECMFESDVPEPNLHDPDVCPARSRTSLW